LLPSSSGHYDFFLPNHKKSLDKFRIVIIMKLIKDNNRSKGGVVRGHYQREGKGKAKGGTRAEAIKGEAKGSKRA
jgi:hypothetical protein